MKLMIVFPASLGDVDMLLLYFNLLVLIVIYAYLLIKFRISVIQYFLDTATIPV